MVAYAGKNAGRESKWCRLTMPKRLKTLFCAVVALGTLYFLVSGICDFPLVTSCDSSRLDPPLSKFPLKVTVNGKIADRDFSLGRTMWCREGVNRTTAAYGRRGYGQLTPRIVEQISDDVWVSVQLNISCHAIQNGSFNQKYSPLSVCEKFRFYDASFKQKKIRPYSSRAPRLAWFDSYDAPNIVEAAGFSPLTLNSVSPMIDLDSFTVDITRLPGVEIQKNRTLLFFWNNNTNTEGYPEIESVPWDRSSFMGQDLWEYDGEVLIGDNAQVIPFELIPANSWAAKVISSLNVATLYALDTNEKGQLREQYGEFIGVDGQYMPIVPAHEEGKWKLDEARTGVSLRFRYDARNLSKSMKLVLDSETGRFVDFQRTQLGNLPKINYIFDPDKERLIVFYRFSAYRFH